MHDFPYFAFFAFFAVYPACAGFPHAGPFLRGIADSIFLRKRFFPALMVTFPLANAIFAWADQIVGALVNNTLSFEELVRVTAACCVWIPYMRVSERVKATFIE